MSNRREPSIQQATKKSEEPAVVELGMGDHTPPRGVIPFALIVIRLITFGMVYYSTTGMKMQNRQLLDIVPWWVFMNLSLARFVYDITCCMALYCREMAGIKWPDQAVYTTASGELVLLDPRGSNGEFNRIQRAAGNFSEYIAFFLVYHIVASLYYPELAAQSFVVWAIGRFAYALGYLKNAHYRVPGFVIAQQLGLCFHESILLYLAYVHYQHQHM